MLHEHAQDAGPVVAAGKVILLVEDNADHAQIIKDLISQETPYFVVEADRGSRHFYPHAHQLKQG